MPLIILKWKNRLEKVCRIHKNGAKNLQVTRTELSIFCAEFWQPYLYWITYAEGMRNHCKCNTSIATYISGKHQHCVSIQNQQCHIYNNYIANFDLHFCNCKSNYVTYSDIVWTAQIYTTQHSMRNSSTYCCWQKC